MSEVHLVIEASLTYLGVEAADADAPRRLDEVVLASRHKQVGR